MFCGKCGNMVKDGARFCGKCGAQIVPMDSLNPGQGSMQPQMQYPGQGSMQPQMQYPGQGSMQSQMQYSGQQPMAQQEQNAAPTYSAPSSAQQAGTGAGSMMWQVTMQGQGAGGGSQMWEMEFPQQRTQQAQPQPAAQTGSQPQWSSRFTAQAEQAVPQQWQQPAAPQEQNQWAEQPQWSQQQTAQTQPQQWQQPAAQTEQTPWQPPTAPAEQTQWSQQQEEQAQPQKQKKQKPQQTGGMHADQYGGKWQRFYLIDFLIRMVRVKENIPLFIYLLMNIVLIGFVMTMFTYGNIALGFALGFGLYLLSMTIALSSVGEKILRVMVGCKKIQDPALMSRLMPIFQEVYARAKQMNPNLPDDVQLFINDDDAPNAFATGRRTVCVTKGLLSRTDEQIRGTLGHEFGHLSHRDTDRILVISIGNAFITIFCAMIRIGAYIFEIFAHIFGIFLGGDEGFFFVIMSSASRFITVHGVGLFMALWMWIGTALCMKTSRGNEYQADEFSCRLGYGQGLMETLLSFGKGARPEGLFAALASSHPATEERVARIQTLMAQYGGGR